MQFSDSMLTDFDYAANIALVVPDKLQDDLLTVENKAAMLGLPIS